MSSLDQRIDDYDWEHIFDHYTRPTHVRTKEARESCYSRDDIAEIVAIENGENDGAEWLAVFRMSDGKFMSVRAGCDYTGWGCQEGGSSDLVDTLEDVVAFGLTHDERQRLGLGAAEVSP